MIYPITYSRLIARELQLDEAGQRELLAGTGMTPAELASLDLDIGQEAQFTIVRNALSLSGNPALGLQWGSRLHVSSHGSLGLLLAASPNLEIALQGAARYYAVRESAVTVELEPRDTEIAVVLKLQIPLDEIGLFFLESMLASLQRNGELITGHSPAQFDVRIELGYPAPAHAERYGDYLHCSFRFGCAKTALIIPLALTKTPNPYGDTALYQQALARCEELVEARKEASSWRQKTSLLLRQNPGQLWTLNEVAQHFHLSPRTLIRHLKREDTSYQTLLDEELGRLALIYLGVSRSTVESVAMALGYQDVTAFRRAFKRWFGMSPSEYRQQNLTP